MVVLAIGLLVVAAWLFERRDYGAAAWSRRPRSTRPTVPARAWSVAPLLRTLTTAILARGWIGLLGWAASAAVFVGAMVWMQPAVMQVWADFDITAGLAGGLVGTAEAQYLAFIGEVLAPVVAAYVVTQASGWVADLDQGRVEAVLAGPVSWARLVWERILAATVGVVAITTAGLVTMAVGARLVGSELSSDGLVRLGVTCVLFGVAVAGVASVVVVWLRSGVAVTVLALYLGLAYLLTLLVPMLRWPEWVSRLSVLWAFGHPYLEWSSTAGIVVLLVLAVLGGLLAAAIAGRTPKIA
jgi:ABC-2 type transport system permease protein